MLFQGIRADLRSFDEVILSAKILKPLRYF